MSDVADTANDYAERLTAAAIARREAEARAARPTHQRIRKDTGERVCMDCYEGIPAERLAAQPDAVRCTFCQEIFERGRL